MPLDTSPIWGSSLLACKISLIWPIIFFANWCYIQFSNPQSSIQRSFSPGATQYSLLAKLFACMQNGPFHEFDSSYFFFQIDAISILFYSLEYIGEVLAVLAARAGWELIFLQQQSKHLFKLHPTETFSSLDKLSNFTQVSTTPYDCLATLWATRITLAGRTQSLRREGLSKYNPSL